MLVLSRKIGEQVMIGNNISVTVIAVRGNQIRLGFTAPEDTLIRREELSFEVAMPASEQGEEVVV